MCLRRRLAIIGGNFRHSFFAAQGLLCACLVTAIILAAAPGGAFAEPAAPSLAHASDLQEKATELHDRGEYAKTLPLAEEALKIRQSISDTPQSEIADSFYLLALINKDLGHYRIAETMFTDALNIQKKVYGHDDPRLCNTLIMLAWNHRREVRRG
jgi:tetratricopeptide (TPR) repeat protein